VNQRVGALGAYIVSIDLEKKIFVPVSEWIEIPVVGSKQTKVPEPGHVSRKSVNAFFRNFETCRIGKIFLDFQQKLCYALSS